MRSRASAAESLLSPNWLTLFAGPSHRAKDNTLASLPARRPCLFVTIGAGQRQTLMLLWLWLMLLLVAAAAAAAAAATAAAAKFIAENGALSGVDFRSGVGFINEMKRNKSKVSSDDPTHCVLLAVTALAGQSFAVCRTQTS